MASVKPTVIPARESVAHSIALSHAGYGGPGGAGGAGGCGVGITDRLFPNETSNPTKHSYSILISINLCSSIILLLIA